MNNFNTTLVIVYRIFRRLEKSMDRRFQYNSCYCLSEDMKKGKTTVFTIIAKLDDPDAMGAERIKLSGCTLDKLTLADWENAKLGEESIGFTFTGFETLDLIG